MKEVKIHYTDDDCEVQHKEICIPDAIDINGIEFDGNLIIDVPLGFAREEIEIKGVHGVETVTPITTIVERKQKEIDKLKQEIKQWEETCELMSDNKVIKELTKSVKQLKEGKVKSISELKEDE